VTVSMRTPPNIFPRDWLGAPLGPSALLGEHLPAAPVDAIGRFIQWRVYGDLSPYGIPRAPEGYATRFRRTGVNPAVDDGFVDALKAGRAAVVAEVRLSGSIRASGQHARRIAKAVGGSGRERSTARASVRWTRGACG